MTIDAMFERMIAETERWRVFHKKNRNHIEAAACAIRLKALMDAYDEYLRLQNGA